jgi:lysyl-tRNA synthetase class 2
MHKYRQFEIKPNLELRARIIQAVRRFFIQRGYLEVETPCRIPAPAPEANIDLEISGDWFLQASPEICMKMLLAADYRRIFQICKCFRRAERGKRHLPELTMLEWYSTAQNYMDIMKDCEQLIQFVLKDLGIEEPIVYQGVEIKLKPPWQRMTVAQAFARYASMPMNEAVSRDRFDEIMVEELEPQFGSNPLFLYDYPASRGSLARLKPDAPYLAERFELYIGGLELCNAFSELTDPVEQRRRFEKEQTIKKLSGKPVSSLPEKFLHALADIPQAAGNAMGIDRLVMLFADEANIDEVVAFRPEEL